MHRSLPLLASILALTLGCGGNGDAVPDDGGADVVVLDASSDGRLSDVGPIDTGVALDTGSDPGLSETGLSDVGKDASSACNDLVSGALVPNTRVPGAPPEPLKGGTLVDGTYVLTKMVEYTGPGGTSLPGVSQRAAMKITAGIYQAVSGAGATVERVTGTYSVSGVTFTVVATCPKSSTQAVDYEVRGADLVFRLKSGSIYIEYTWTKV